MRVIEKTPRPLWSLTLRCTNSWCMCRLLVGEDDVRYDTYPEETGVVGEGFFIQCTSCSHAMILHSSMLYTPFAERIFQQRS